MTSATQVKLPAVILIDPQLGENIGMAARAMHNCALADLRLVRPRDGWPSPQAQAAASGADVILENARLFDDTAAAIADLNCVYATTARSRGMVKPVVSPREAATLMRNEGQGGSAVGILFGPERSGLVNDDVALADRVISVPLNPAFTSLNLSQAVLLVGYEWLQAGLEDSEKAANSDLAGLADQIPVEKEQLLHFFERLEGLLDDTGFLRPPEKRPAMVRSLRNLFARMSPSDQDLRTLHGIISALVRRSDSS
jgi:tRNA/rRNA methyltransferase